LKTEIITSDQSEECLFFLEDLNGRRVIFNVTLNDIL
jgi:hypothetical protein